MNSSIDPINGFALVAELREDFGCEVSLTREGKARVKFPPERPSTPWIAQFIREHLLELVAALQEEQTSKKRTEERKEASL